MWKNWHCVLNHKKVKILGKIRQLNLDNKKFTNFNLVTTFKIKYRIQGIRFKKNSKNKNYANITRKKYIFLKFSI